MIFYRHFFKNTSVFILLCIVLNACSNNYQSIENEKEIYCDAEATIIKDNKSVFVNNSYYFESGESQSNEKAHSGKFSCKVKKGREFGMCIKLNDIQKGAYLEISVWKYSNKLNSGAIVVSSEKAEDLYVKEYYPCIQEENGWKKTILNVLIPKKMDVLKIYVYNPLDEDVYFDDLKIKYHKKKTTLYKKENALNIQIPKESYKTIIKNRNIALEQGIIDKKLKKYFDASITYMGKKIPIEIRLKGDWTDHLEGHKWSYRIKTSKGHAFKGMKSFSIQSPNTRSFLNEWVIHKMFEKEGVLTTRYDFIPVYINNVEIGVYAIEEHFEKQLLESKDKREGPILKFDEEGVWEMALNYGGDGWNTIPYYDAASILPFKKKKTLKSKTLKQQFIIGQNLLYQFKSHRTDLKNIFDIQNITKYYALVDLFGAHHAMAWHNQRFYFNPVTCLIEPIGYDFSILEIPEDKNPKLVCLGNMESTNIPYYSFLNFNLIQQKPFLEKYFNYLNSFTTNKYQEDFYKSIEKELSDYTALISKEYEGYYFNIKMAKTYAQKIHKKTREIDPSKTNKFVKNHSKLASLKDTSLYLSETGLKAFMEEKENNKSVITIKNYHLTPIKIIGYSIKKNKDSLILLPNPIELKEFNRKQTKKRKIEINAQVKNLYFNAENIPNKILKKKVVGWPSPKTQNPRLELEEKHRFGKSSSYKIKNDIVLFSGKEIISEFIYIPEKYTVIFEAGTKLYFKNKSGIISHSPIFMNGTKESPIIISGDSANQGIHVLQARKKSALKWTTFSGLNTLNYKGWSLTGAVTFYESDVVIEHCVFEHNKCEDALNVIRSNFTFLESLIQYTFADGLDGDFCDGEIKNSIFKNTNNDCIDFSGSTISIKNCNINNAGDKAISGGEKSNISIENIKVNNANIGVASKDLSQIDIKSSSFNNINIVYAAYQKKAEYGPAKIKSYLSKYRNYKKRQLIDLGSEIYDNKNKSTGRKKINIDFLYQDFK